MRVMSVPWLHCEGSAETSAGVAGLTKYPCPKTAIAITRSAMSMITSMNIAWLWLGWKLIWRMAEQHRARDGSVLEVLSAAEHDQSGLVKLG